MFLGIKLYDEEIVEEVIHEGEESDSENEEQTPSCAVTPSQACAAFDCALECLESKGYKTLLILCY